MRNWMALLFLGLIGMAGYIALTKPEEEANLHIPEQYQQRIAELEAKIAHLEDDCTDGCVYCGEYAAFSYAVSDLAPGIVSPETKLTVIEAPKDAMGPDPLLDEAATALQSLAAQLAEARDKALEEAAVAYEAETHTWTAWPEAGAARRKGAKAIRALKGSQQ
jgi:hypothetical protein